MQNDPLAPLSFAVRNPNQPSGLYGIEHINPRCRLYRRGHCAHSIQLRLSYSSDAPPVSGEIFEIRDGLITVYAQGRALQFLNHETALLRLAVERHGAHVFLRSHSILGLRHEGGEYVFTLHDAGEPWTPCEPDRSEGCEIPSGARDVVQVAANDDDPEVEAEPETPASGRRLIGFFTADTSDDDIVDAIIASLPPDKRPVENRPGYPREPDGVDEHS
jgi:hypothetical protein